MREWLITPRFRDYSALGLLNMFVLQWFFIRLQASMSSLPNFKLITFRVIGPIWPLTGWWNNYRWVGRR